MGGLSKSEYAKQQAGEKIEPKPKTKPSKAKLSKGGSSRYAAAAKSRLY